MHRIDSDGATLDNKFTEGNPATSTPATIVSAAILNAFQEELALFIESQGITLLTSGTDTFTQLQDALDSFLQKGGAPVTQAIANNTGPADVGAAGELEFDPATVRAVIMKYAIHRRSDSSSVDEVGELKLCYDTEASAWKTPTGQSNFDDAGVIFSMTDVSGGPNDGFGKIQYTSDDLTGASYSGSLTITDVKVINQ